MSIISASACIFEAEGRWKMQYVFRLSAVDVVVRNLHLSFGLAVLVSWLPGSLHRIHRSSSCVARVHWPRRISWENQGHSKQWSEVRFLRRRDSTKITNNNVSCAHHHPSACSACWGVNLAWGHPEAPRTPGGLPRPVLDCGAFIITRKFASGRLWVILRISRPRSSMQRRSRA